MRKRILYLVSAIISVLTVCGFIFDKSEFVYLGLYIYFTQRAIVVAIEYNETKAITAGTIWYSTIFIIITAIFAYSALFIQ